MAMSTFPQLPLTISKVEKFTVVEFRTASLMDPLELQGISEALYRLVDVEDNRLIVLDFERVEYIASQAIGILISLHKKLAALPHSRFVLCGVSPRLMELLRITRLDKMLLIKPTQKEAVKQIPS